MIFEMCPNARLNKLNQGEMIATQFAFIGLFILYPKFFGAHYATDEELEAFCHVWRGLGYLLGIDDRLVHAARMFFFRMQLERESSKIFNRVRITSIFRLWTASQFFCTRIFCIVYVSKQR